MLVTMDTERRKFTRFLGPENAYAALGPSFEQVGRIKDISIGGLALVYLTDEEFVSKNSQVDIFLRGEECITCSMKALSHSIPTKLCSSRSPFHP